MNYTIDRTNYNPFVNYNFMLNTSFAYGILKLHLNLIEFCAKEITFLQIMSESCSGTLPNIFQTTNAIIMPFTFRTIKQQIICIRQI